MAKAIMCGVELPSPPSDITDITEQCYHKADLFFYPIADTNTFGTQKRDEGSTIHTLWIPAYGKHKYRVKFTPMMNFENMLWYNFLFVDFPIMYLVVPANNENVSKYVARIDDRTFIIETPEDCGEVGINYVVADGIKVYQLGG